MTTSDSATQEIATKESAKPKTVKGRPKKSEQLEKASKTLRNEHGLISSLSYTLDEAGFVNWRKLIPERFLFPNSRVFEALKKPVPDSIKGLSDDEILIRLGGLKWIAKVRGYTRVEISVSHPTPDVVVAHCDIDWIANSEGPACSYSDVGSVSSANSDGITRKFAESVAANRAFARAVRNFLNINCASDVEMNLAAKPSADDTTVDGGKITSLPTDPISVFMQHGSEKFQGSMASLVEFIRGVYPSFLKDVEEVTPELICSNLDVPMTKKLLRELKRPQHV